jgi:hypothetical protein
MSSPAASPLRVGQVLEIKFPTFTPRITFRSERELTVEIIAGDNRGFSDTVEYRLLRFAMGLCFFLGRNTSEAPSCTCSIWIPVTYTPQ